MSLKHVKTILDQISNTASTKEKAEIIEKNKTNSDFRDVVFYALDYQKKYNVTSITKQPVTGNLSINSIFKYLDVLALKNGCTRAEANKLACLSSFDDETIDVVNRIINKDLRCGASHKIFLKSFPTIPYFEVMTCQSDLTKFLKESLKTSKNKTNYNNVMASLKKDGVRTWNICNVSSVQHISRSGLNYPNFSIFDPEMITLCNYLHSTYQIPYPITLDGESTSKDKSFNSLMSSVRSQEVDPTIFEFNVFDFVSDTLNLEERYEILKDAFKNLSLTRVSLLDHWDCSKYQHEYQFVGLMNWAVNVMGEEGIVLKIKNSPYERKEKSKYWCKMKPVETYDLLVVGYYMGKKGKKHENRIGGLIVKYKGVEVRVGSGYSDEEREAFLKKQPRLIEVATKGETPDGSLREPRFIRVRDDKFTDDSQ